MKDSRVVLFLYETMLGRMLLKILVNPLVSKASAYFFSSLLSRVLVPFFVKKNRINMDGYEKKIDEYKSFNDFFTRKRKDEIKIEKNSILVSPCDGLLTISEITAESIFCIKHTRYNIAELLGNERLAKEYKGGTALVFRLTPAHYHRYIWSTTGFLYGMKQIPGILHSVQPICHEKVKVYIQNTREYAIINSESIGNVIQMEIGALLVGKISNHMLKKNQMVCIGQEKGFFEYGGSSIVILTRQKIELLDELKNRKQVGDEIPVIIGEKIMK